MPSEGIQGDEWNAYVTLDTCGSLLRSARVVPGRRMRVVGEGRGGVAVCPGDMIIVLRDAEPEHKLAVDIGIYRRLRTSTDFRGREHQGQVPETADVWAGGFPLLR
ncbi:hypothetical protein Acsp02_56200 [Actinoplanes sp. NBRC 103695]|nr:hypothetical protein Acsp02_56200 [Actinoplanes sp. NBRC 103695]